VHPFRSLSLVLLAAAFAAAPAVAGPLAPSKPSQLVTVRYLETGCPLAAPDPGTTANALDEMSTLEGLQQPFVIPPRQALVITSVNFTVVGEAGDSFGMNLIAVNGTQRAVLAQALVKTEAEGVGSLTIPIPTGIAIREGNALCMVASAGGTPAGAVTGFFAKDK
jgi:hypothetical protein